MARLHVDAEVEVRVVQWRQEVHRLAGTIPASALDLVDVDRGQCRGDDALGVASREDPVASGFQPPVLVGQVADVGE